MITKRKIKTLKKGGLRFFTRSAYRLSDEEQYEINRYCTNIFEILKLSYIDTNTDIINKEKFLELIKKKFNKKFLLYMRNLFNTKEYKRYIDLKTKDIEKLQKSNEIDELKLEAEFEELKAAIKKREELEELEELEENEDEINLDNINLDELEHEAEIELEREAEIELEREAELKELKELKYSLFEFVIYMLYKYGYVVHPQIKKLSDEEFDELIAKKLLDKEFEESIAKKRDSESKNAPIIPQRSYQAEGLSGENVQTYFYTDKLDINHRGGGMWWKKTIDKEIQNLFECLKYTNIITSYDTPNIRIFKREFEEYNRGKKYPMSFFDDYKELKTIQDPIQKIFYARSLLPPEFSIHVQIEPITLYEQRIGYRHYKKYTRKVPNSIHRSKINDYR